MEGTIIPITLAYGWYWSVGDSATTSQRCPVGVSGRCSRVWHPVQLKENATRQDVTSAPAIVQRRSETERVGKKRSWEKEALIIGGSAGAWDGDRGDRGWQERGEPSARQPAASAAGFTTS